jgi:predicted metal-dependent phosphoesterase TrpH
MASGALVIQAHPYREAGYIDHIRLFPRQVHGIETPNASRPDFENNIAAYYADYYGLITVAGSDNHSLTKQKHLAGLEFETPIRDEADYITRVMARQAKIFTLNLENS